MLTRPDYSRFAADLLDWYDQNARTLPWRVSPADRKRGILPDPYHIWLSEVMLQQTTVSTVRGYFARFVDKWPDIKAMAATDEEEILKAWAGLGYYSRARNLKKCADIIATEFGGLFPEDPVELRKLPGVGDYTSAAISAIAFDRAAPVVDGNIERIVSRLLCIDTPLPKSKPQIRAVMAELVPNSRPGDFVQAMMDLGASVCSPRGPECCACPVAAHCLAAQTGTPENWPVRVAKKQKPERVGAAFVAVAPDGSILLQKRADTGLLAGMSEVPTTQWSAQKDGKTGKDAAPFKAEWQECGMIRHTFTHFCLTLEVFRTKCAVQPITNGWWSNAVEDEALPTVFNKVIDKALED